MSTLTTATRDSIREINEEFMTAAREGDAHRMAQLYTAQAQLLPPGEDVVTGHEQIEQYWKQVVTNVGTVMIEIQELEAFDDTAVEIGRYEMAGDDGAFLDEGKYMALWKRDHDHWKLHRDIWNSSRHPQE